MLLDASTGLKVFPEPLCRQKPFSDMNRASHLTDFGPTPSRQTRDVDHGHAAELCRMATPSIPSVEDSSFTSAHPILSDLLHNLSAMSEPGLRGVSHSILHWLTSLIRPGGGLERG